MTKVAIVGATGPTGIHLAAELRKTIASHGALKIRRPWRPSPVPTSANPCVAGDLHAGNVAPAHDRLHLRTAGE